MWLRIRIAKTRRTREVTPEQKTREAVSSAVSSRVRINFMVRQKLSNMTDICLTTSRSKNLTKIYAHMGGNS